jgi:hypothetical protein
MGELCNKFIMISIEQLQMSSELIIDAEQGSKLSLSHPINTLRARPRSIINYSPIKKMDIFVFVNFGEMQIQIQNFV